MIILKGLLIDDVPNSYVSKTGVKVFYRDVMVKTDVMKFETVRVPADYKLVKDKDGYVTFASDDSFLFGSTARRYNFESKKFEYTPISYYISVRKAS